MTTNIKYVGKMIGLLIIGINMLSGCKTNDTHAEQLVLDKGDGSVLSIPTSGPLANEKAIAICHEIQTIDARFDKLQRSLSTTTNDPKVVSAMLELVLEYRNGSVSDLDLAYRISQKTSAGILDWKLLKAAKEKSVKAFQILETKPPPRLYVKTEISTSVVNAVIHYISLGDYHSKTGYWSSYNFGKRIRIGEYVFRVKSSDSTIEPCEEVVLVLSDPTVHKIIPRT